MKIGQKAIEQTVARAMPFIQRTIDLHRSLSASLLRAALLDARKSGLRVIVPSPNSATLVRMAAVIDDCYC